jgi:hypothetical protein
MDAEGMVQVPRESAGLGITVDTDFIDSLTVRSEVLAGGETKVFVA